ncbi:vomeronasal type-1 receptor 1-like [Bos javanicus]|uniref:vomeronasal type-1 receptor 1-like n=1 Tax=Bos javanicus TaxID=9906 RepID=UPI002AA697B1|nr:vomeronasal type-1 receptor 1-like [Bos javanicus]
MSFQKDVLRTASQEALKTTCLLQIGVGSLVNVILFIHNVSPVLFGHKQRPTDKILTHMALASLLVLLSSGIPHTMTAFVSSKPLSSPGYKLVYYIHRVACSTTLCSTCVLSTYQSFTLIPRSEGRSLLRGRPLRVTDPPCWICWIFSALVIINILVNISGPQDTHNYSDTQGRWFCMSLGHKSGFTFLWSVSDAIFISLMIWSSGCTVLLLHRHHQKMKYNHTLTEHRKCPPETRATTHMTLMLVVTTVVYVLNSVFAFCISAFHDFHLWLLQTSSVLVSCFPTVSRFLFLLRDPRAPRFCS